MSNQTGDQRVTANAEPYLAWGDADVSRVDRLRRRAHAALDDRLARFPCRDGHLVSLLRDGPETYEAMLAAFDQASVAINLMSYAFAEGQSANRIAEGLIAARRRGVTVRVLYDWIGSSECPSTYFKTLRDNGIFTRPVRPPLHGLRRGIAAVNRRNHRKLATIDGRVGFVGGVNITQTYRRHSRVLRRRTDFSEPRYADDAWRDTHVEIDGPAVADLDTIFFEDWCECRDDAALPTGDATRGPWNAPSPVDVEMPGNACVRVTTTSAVEDLFNEPFALYAHALRHARRSVEITHSYFAPPRWLLADVCRTAKRGVDVRLIVPGRSDNPLAFHASRTNYGRLLRAGVRVFEMQECYLHAKTMVVDGWWSIVGSANLDMRSWLHNDETCVVLYDEDFAARMQRQFALDLAASQELSRRRWRKRGLRERLKEHATRPIYRWL
jgi:cardiolipin synthase